MPTYNSIYALHIYALHTYALHVRTYIGAYTVYHTV